jgi:hypothetical protein
MRDMQERSRAPSRIEIENTVHAFTASDRLHPLKEVINILILGTISWLDGRGSFITCC